MIHDNLLDGFSHRSRNIDSFLAVVYLLSEIRDSDIRRTSIDQVSYLFCQVNHYGIAFYRSVNTYFTEIYFHNSTVLKKIYDPNKIFPLSSVTPTIMPPITRRRTLSKSKSAGLKETPG